MFYSSNSFVYFSVIFNSILDGICLFILYETDTLIGIKMLNLIIYIIYIYFNYMNY